MLNTGGNKYYLGNTVVLSRHSSDRQKAPQEIQSQKEGSIAASKGWLEGLELEESSQSAPWMGLGRRQL